MNITNLRPIRDAGTLVALFDLEVSPEIKLLDWQLRQTKNGLRAYPPSPRNGRPSASLAPALFSEIGRMAATAFERGNAQYDRS